MHIGAGEYSRLAFVENIREVRLRDFEAELGEEEVFEGGAVVVLLAEVLVRFSETVKGAFASLSMHFNMHR